MAATINIAVYSDVLVVLGTAGVVVPLVQRFGVNPVLGYLGAGALLGPLGLGAFVATVPVLYWFTVVDAKNVAAVADLGVVFLLFLIGLELSFERLRAMRRLVLGLGGLQVLITSVVLSLALAALQLDTIAAVILGTCLALSSTAVVLDVLSRQKRMVSHAGRSSFAVLLAQDLAVIPILMLISILGAKSGLSVFGTVAAALGQAMLAVALIFVIGRIGLRPLYRIVAGTGSSELFIATTLFAIIATGVVAALAGLSMALGAFVAGLLLAETEYRKAIEATIEPFKGLLLGIFFFTIGMTIDPRVIAQSPGILIGSVVGLIAVKSLIAFGLGRLFRLPTAAALEMSLLLGPGGEFAFVAIGLAASYTLLSPPVASIAVAVTALTMAFIPLLAWLGMRLAPRFEPTVENPELAVRPQAQRGHAIVIGYGRFGTTVCALLDRHGIPFVAVDDNTLTVSAERAGGKAVYYGNATDPRFLHACGLIDASCLVITTHTRSSIDQVVAIARMVRPELPIIVRARDAEHAQHLYRIGVTDAVPETIEASLQLSEAALVGLGVPIGAVIASIHEERDIVRQGLRTAAESAGVPRTPRPSGRRPATPADAAP